jgi:hypothetical protein
MLIVLPALCFALILCSILRRRNAETPIRSAFLRAAVIWGVMLAGITELLSVFGALSAGAIAVCWAIGAAAWGVTVLATPGGPMSRWVPEVPARSLLALGLPIVVIVLGTGLSAAAGWSNQWDAMVYHLPRVDHWIQDRSVAFYPSHIIRQLYSPPWAEYAILQLRVLGGDDRWANAPQWFSMVGSLLGVSLIAQRLGAALRGQLLSALFCATIPMGILQASGAQNDYVVAFWLVCLAEAALAPSSLPRALQIGASLGLALLSKGTALVFGGALLLGAPLLVTAGGSGAPSWPTRVTRGTWALLIAATLNAPHWSRNIEAFGSPLGPQQLGSAGEIGDKLTNDALSPGILASNVVRNLSLHVGTPSRTVNLALEQAIARGHAWFGLDLEDPRSTRLYSLSHFAIFAGSTDPDRTGNPLHLLLILAAGVRIIVSAPLRRSPRVGRYGLVLASAFLLFCLVLKWQPWHSRLHLPLFVLAGPLVGVAWEGSAGMLALASVLMTALAAQPLLQNRLAPLSGGHTVFNTPRMHQYFQSFSDAPNAGERAYVAAAQVLGATRCRDLGLVLGWDDWEHPLWVLLSEQQPAGGWRVEHVGVRNNSARLASRFAPFAPCAVVVGSVSVGDSLELRGRSYLRFWSADRLSVLLPPSSP